jgi:hypothetical protein
MAKGKKTTIKNIKKLSDNTIMINSNTYVILEDTEDIETAITMKVTSHGNRILRFKDENKKARIDLLRELHITKYTINDDERAAKFKRGYDLTLLEEKDTIESVATATCHTQAIELIASFSDKKSENYDKRAGVNTFYIFSEG